MQSIEEAELLQLCCWTTTIKTAAIQNAGVCNQSDQDRSVEHKVIYSKAAIAVMHGHFNRLINAFRNK